MKVDPYIRPEQHKGTTSVTETDKREIIIERVFLIDPNGKVVLEWETPREVDVFVFMQEDGSITIPDGFILKVFPELQEHLDGNLDCKLSVGLREERFKVDIRSPNKTKLAKAANKQQRRVANKLNSVKLSPLAQALLKGNNHG